MNIGLVKEHRLFESRVSLTPTGVAVLAQQGHQIYVEHGAGELSGFLDEDYIQSGAKIVYSTEEVYGRADLLLKISPLTTVDLPFLRDGQIISSAMHLAIAPREVFDALLEKKITAIGIELIQNERGHYPILVAMSEIAGRMSIQIAAQYLQSNRNGRGILLSGVPGVPEAVILVLGAGVVGRNATMTALGVGAHVVVLDENVMKLRKIETLTKGLATTNYSNPVSISKSLRFADVVIGAVLRPGGERTPHLITEEMVKSMKPQSLLIDISIDQGGCAETSRPMTLSNPVFVKHGINHHCVPNIPAAVARTATHSLNNVLSPFVNDIANHGLKQVIEHIPPFSRSIFTYNGHSTNENTSKVFGVPFTKIFDALR